MGNLDLMKFVRREAEPKPVAHKQHLAGGVSSRLEVDGGVADENGVGGCYVKVSANREQPRRIRFAAVRRVTADHELEVSREIQRFEQAIGGALRLVREYGQRHPRCERLEHCGGAVVRRCVFDQPLVVQLQKSRQRIRHRRIEPRRGEHATHEHRRTFADHRRDRAVCHRLPAELANERVRRIRKVAAGIDERSIQIKDR